MKRLLSFLLITVLLTGCASVLPKVSWPLWSDLKSKSFGLADAKAKKDALDRMTEISNREKAAREALDKKYEEFRGRISEAYSNRSTIDDENFDRISELNYGIWYVTKDIVDIDKRVLIANLRAKANMARLMPMSESMKTIIESDIDSDLKNEVKIIYQKYEEALEEGAAAVAAYEEADRKVKELEKEKQKLREEEKIVLARLNAEHENEKSRLKQEAENAVLLAKQNQKQEMIGWIVKSLLVVGIIILIAGFLMKSPTFIISGISMLALAYVAATIPFWVVATLMGLFIFVMIIVDPKTGKVPFGGKKKIETQL